MLLYQQDNWDGWGANLPYNMLGMVGRATYSFDDRYMAEFNFGYNGSEQFAPNNRFGSFPAFSVGWLASNESFLKDNPIVTNLKFRASYGKTGNDKLGSSRFLYQSFITMGGGFIPTLGHGQQVNQGRMGNEVIQWEVAEKKNIGVEFELINSLSFILDAYTEHRDKILISRKTIPILQGVPIGNIPQVNIGVMDNKGYEAEVIWKKQLSSDIMYSIKGNIGYNENVVIFSDEVQYGEDYVYRYRQTGFSYGQPFGYQIDYSNGNGYINTQEELDNLPVYEVGGTPRLGDFKYVDVNGDGRINDKDMIPIGYGSVPRISYGLSGTLNYKNLDFSFLFSGIAKSSVTMTGWGVSEFGLVGFYNGWHFDAWTPERYANGEKILYPALSMSAGVSQKANNVFIMDRSFLRLKNLEIGYNIPKDFMKYLSLESARIYVNGSNLWTWDKLPVSTIDPEQSGALSYGLTRTINFGLNLVF
jgi:TonB-linked SusC/RagA family outer membrane protein